jgi:predicted alpha/beta hydrolase
VDFENIQGQVVTITTEDNVKLNATLYGDGPIAVILAHMGLTGVTQKSWQLFAKYISTLGYSALTLDFRGRGHSEGALIQSNLKYDIDAAVRFLRDQGYQRIVCMGTSM